MPGFSSGRLIRPGLLLLLLQLFTGALLAAPEIPTLSGRVVDQAELLDAAQETALSSRLEALEVDSSNQIVVVTLNDLQGYDIARFGVELGRAWGIGQEGKDNGALLIVAPNERKVRIEVGYGLEGFLTDATSQLIIQREILPAFRNGDFPLGINQGVDAMIGAIDGSYKAEAQDRRGSSGGIEGYFPLLFIAIIAVSEFLKRHVSRGIAGNVAFGGIAGLIVTVISQSILFGILAAIGVFLLTSLLGAGGGGGPGTGAGGITHGGREGGFGGGSFGSGGGFSGGGGGFGGGGASGGW
ncbi:MAG: TPM domain-containing protein [Gammaproteobacteria bacterium]|nr:TPM domain-containing protein [Gammaproteobacteria bacterium]